MAQVPPKILLDIFFKAFKTFYQNHPDKQAADDMLVKMVPFPSGSRNRKDVFYDIFEDVYSQLNINDTETNERYSNIEELFTRRYIEVIKSYIKDEKNFGMDDEYLNLIYRYTYNSDEYTSVAKHFLNLQRELTENNFDEPHERVKKPLAIMFYSRLQNILKQNTVKNDEILELPFDYLMERFGLHANDLMKMLFAEPSALSSIIFPPSPQFEIKSELFEKSMQDYKAVLLGHALSIHSDSIFLLAELGRTMRIAKALDKPVNVFLTGEKFGVLNWIVQDYIELKDEEKGQHPRLNIETNIRECLAFRTKLYSNLGLSYEICDFGNAGSDYFPESTALQLEVVRTAHEYHQLCLLVLKDKTYPRKVNREEAREIIEIFDNFLVEDTEGGISGLSIVKRDLKKHIGIIKMVVDNLRSFSVNTFEYFLLQYYHQFKYHNCLKLAVSREFTFDDLFEKMIDKEGIDYQLGGLYFKDYICNTDDGEKTVFPYYFPSGSLYTGNPTQIADFEHNVILIKDRRDKIKRILNTYKNPFKLAAVMGDLLSFAHYYFIKNDKTKGNHFDEEFMQIAERLSEEFSLSWKYYTHLDETDFRKNVDYFEQLLLSQWSRNIIVPYYFYPFLLSDGINAKSNADKRETLLECYTEIIHLILRELEKSMDFGANIRHWSIQL